MKKLLTLFLFVVSLTAYAQTAEYDTDRGFIHPGGLHTQADFDRIKQQLKDGNTRVKSAYQKLTSAAYAQASVQTYPQETIVRGGGSGENYINAARGATMAYQNALRWKIGGTKANAEAAVRILMAWANTTKAITGNSDQCLAVGLYGYQFAQAAELMRDYEGWSREEFRQFQDWMLTLWYPKAINFLRGRNGTWENSGKWWQAPGHYWSNWGLCNILCVISIGILCDDVFIYNQGMSYFKYDQVGTFVDPRKANPILNDGLTDFLGNLVVTTSNVSESTFTTGNGTTVVPGAYGQIGQMNESGRDTGHSAMALGLAIDIAKVGWNQGDDLFAYMDHRLSAGIEYVAAQTQSVEGLPWTNYHYGSSGYYYSDSRAWLMTGPALGAQMRPYWGTVIGIYEGVKGVKMPFSDISYVEMGIDAGGQGGTSGGYDHLGYSVLMNTRDEQLCPADKVPTELTPQMEYSGTLNSNLIPSLAQERTRRMISGKTLLHNELGGLVNTFSLNNKTGVPTGQTLTLKPQLPEGEEDTGQWTWNTGEQTREITVPTDKSFIYRVTYTNRNGIESQLCFPIAVQGDNRADQLTPVITIGSTSMNATSARVLYGKTAKLSAIPSGGWGTFKWTGNKTTQEITTPALKKNSDFTVEYTNQGGTVSTLDFHLDVLAAEPYAQVNDNNATLYEDSVIRISDIALVPSSSVAADAGSNVTLGLALPTGVAASNVQWSTGDTGATLSLTDVRESQILTARFTLGGEQVEVPFNVLVRPETTAAIVPGHYLLRHIASDTYMTAHERNVLVTFGPRTADVPEQVWKLEVNSSGRYNFVNQATGDSLLLNASAKTVATSSYPFSIDQAVGSDRLSLRTGSNTMRKYWNVDATGAVVTNAASTLLAFPFQLIPYDATGVDNLPATRVQPTDDTRYDLSGRKTTLRTSGKGVYIRNGRKIIR